MFSVYDKKTGKEIKLPFSVDVKEWLKDSRYTDKKPVKRQTKQTLI